MPLYDYRCPHCGPFQAWATMAESADPADCPACGVPAPRRPMAPFLNTMNGIRRKAQERNERSAHEPRVMGAGELAGLGRPRGGCGHAHGEHGHGEHGDGSGKPRMVRSSRPWMVGH
ncbi:FmdB family zinc ribbon protein [Spiribacter halobius]|uniref:Putative regulatory protein FmdB zinc ribbon domain-containing protein n=1 Tax=Sediminicurvatus halobius TaxID=2182432 RepID=A0A2U2MXW9_9GAMM|nr:zinc ribbon domain-containing protein [Spiribacter halobius]PWG61622.1 hypothetical protein DEM34_15665 [Spiribacter halobius]UEX77299.1 zinc ribbon domain-containing protein [Spiribacter halobius]